MQRNTISDFYFNNSIHDSGNASLYFQRLLVISNNGINYDFDVGYDSSSEIYL